MNSKSRRATLAEVSGILNIDKPGGSTSHDVVARVRKITGQRKVGHAGTLDPMATGVLLLCLGQATRVAEYLMAGRKRYRAVIRLGVSTDTYDADGDITRSVDSFHLSQDQICAVLAEFQGVIRQVPPPFSAIRQGGRRLYELARRGIAVRAPARRVEIESVHLLGWESPYLTLDVICSPGTYVRSLAHDLGQRLEVEGHLASLSRLASGNWLLQNAITLEDLDEAVRAGHWHQLLHPLDAALEEFERVELSNDTARQVGHGQPIWLDQPPETRLARAYAPDQSLVAVLQPSDEPGLWQPKKVFREPQTLDT